MKENLLACQRKEQVAFWNKFEVEIDKTDLAAVTKFTLKNLVKLWVRKQLNGLPFTTEGYGRAKNILQTKYGHTSKVIINANIKNILALLVISGTHPTKIHDFYKTLMYNLKWFDTIAKMADCKALGRGVLKK